MQTRNVHHLRSGGTSVVIELPRGLPGAPVIVYWGEDLGASDAYLDALARGVTPPTVSASPDRPVRLSTIPLESEGWPGTPGLLGSRAGRAFSPSFIITSETTSETASDTTLAVQMVDETTELEAELRLAIDKAGLLHQSITLSNRGSEAYELDTLALTFPLPAIVSEILDTTGRHLRERHPQRHAVTTGRYIRESRRGRPGADATLLLNAGVPGFSFEHGLVFGLHLAWSGSQLLAIERSPSGETFFQAQELLSPGELSLAPGESYTSPTAIASWGDGLNALAGRFHRFVRSRPEHPLRPRPVTINTWEAAYFDLDETRLLALAEKSAQLGIERFVLDDGWFQGRRNDSAGLGDWYVDTQLFPAGLSPLIHGVHELGMEFGLWVEPEMVNPDSDLARNHPDWLLQAVGRLASPARPPVPGRIPPAGHLPVPARIPPAGHLPSAGRLPVPARHQQVLDLSHPAVFTYLLERLDAILSENDIAYLKWDHNRDLLEAGSTRTGRRAIHHHTLALYHLMDELRRRHPQLEIESCASGGARIDLGILKRSERVWTSDCIDPLERLTIQKYTGLLLPPELMGMHIGSPRSHSTGRVSSLGLRAGVALFGHLGVEWDVTGLSPEETEELAAWITLHKSLRSWIHRGRLVHADLADPGAELRGIIAEDGSQAIFTFTQLSSACAYPPPVITFPGLEDERLYHLRLLTTPGSSRQNARGEDQFTVSGRALRLVGFRPPVLFPEELIVIDLNTNDLNTNSE